MSGVKSTNPSKGTQAGPACVDAAWRTLVIVSGLFCAVVALAMLTRDILAHKRDPLKAPELTALKLQLSKSPNDETLKQKIREVDLEIRREYFETVRFKKTGVWLLLMGMGVFLYGAKRLHQMHKAVLPPEAGNDSLDLHLRTVRRGRLATAAVAVAVGVVALTVTFAHRFRLPASESEISRILGGDTGQEAEPPGVAGNPVEYYLNWPRFLGPTGNALTTNATIPDLVDPTNGVGVCWQVPVDSPGFSSPIVWGDRIFVTGGDANERVVLCYDARSGKMIWRQQVRDLPGSPQKPHEVSEGAGPAASTPATDGRHVYAIFGTGDLVAFRFDGGLAWGKNIGMPENPYGHAQSLVAWQGRLIVPMDHGEAAKKSSKLFALDGASGKILWERQRAVESSWATPIVVEAAGVTQIIALGGSWVIAYSMTDGTELWRVECLSGEITPSPVYLAGHILAISPNDRLVAIRPDGRGDVTKTHITWSYQDNIPDISSPVGTDDLLFIVSTPGVMTCLNTRTGTKIWEHDFELEVNATPAMANNRLVLCGRKGQVVVLEAGPEYKELHRFRLEGEIYASPAFASGRMFIRTTTTLYCIGSAAPNAHGPQ